MRAALLVAVLLGAAPLPSAGTYRGTLSVSPHDTALFAARGRTLFTITFPEEGARSITIARVDRAAVRWRRVRFPLAYYLRDLSVGPRGLYAGTAVIKRFTNARDVLLRIDPATLTIRARVSFPAAVGAVEAGDRMWASIGDGRVVRLDPTTLRVLASRRLLAARSVATRGLSLSTPAVGLGSVWILAGDRADLRLLRLDPTTLAVRSRTRLPRNASLSRVVADARHVYVTGRGIASVDARGRLVHLTDDASLDAVAIHGNGLVGLNDAASALELLTARGRVTARTPLRDVGGELAVAGDDAWFLGDDGGGNGIVHVGLRGASHS